ncbi:MAG: hypothetical protein IKP68_06125 [Clostridia bacterium]|nr:hypothetical protein [Clostridia bacterium]
MKLPELYDIPSARSVTEEFLGLNQNLRIGAGEFAAMKNLTSDHYPVLSTRRQRGVYQDNGSTSSEYLSVFAKDRPCWIKGTKVYINGYEVGGVTLNATKPKQVVSMGAYIIIFPDKVWINTLRATGVSAFSHGALGNTFSQSGGTAGFHLCREDGTVYTSVEANPTPPENPVNGTLWIDNSNEKPVLKQYSTSTESWNAITTTYVKISCFGIGSGFADGDGVTISGIVETGEQKVGAEDLNGKTIIQKAYHDAQTPADDYIVVPGILTANVDITYVSGGISVERSIPDLDYVIESNNRLWGCHYGLSSGGTEVLNEIYACKLGDFKNWNVFAGISTDSYTASVGSDGPFTGAVNYLGYPLFFKENCIHKVYGSYPANYQIQTTMCPGVQKGSSKSLSIANEVLYYKSPSDVVAYDGSLPATVSAALGPEAYKDAVGCANEGKYYVSMKDSEGQSHFFAYDVKKGLWHEEDDLRVVDMVSCDGELYMIREDKAVVDNVDVYYGGAIVTEYGSGLPDISLIKWYAETGVIGLSSPDTKNISRITVRLSLSPDARVKFSAQYDSADRWDYLCTIAQRTLRTITVPMKPRRCDHLRLRIEGVGDCKIYSITYTTAQGSEKP